jgi:DNA polymerase III alpha subunit
MRQNKFGELIFTETDVIELVMQGKALTVLDGMIVDDSVNLAKWPDTIIPIPNLQQQKFHTCSVPEFHAQQQQRWHMPEEYRHMDIAAHVLNLCASEAELQRCGQELLLYQERGLFDLLRYLTYLVDVMRENAIIWGVGRGSSVASHVLYKLGVHRIDSLYYNLDISEFLR